MKITTRMKRLKESTIHITWLLYYYHDYSIEHIQSLQHLSKKGVEDIIKLDLNAMRKFYPKNLQFKNLEKSNRRQYTT